VGTIIKTSNNATLIGNSNGLFTSPRGPARRRDCRPLRRARGTRSGQARAAGGRLAKRILHILQSGFYTRNGMGFVRHCNCTEYLYTASCGCWKLPALCTYRAFSAVALCRVVGLAWRGAVPSPSVLP
jgi:hypothetical protein